jgi:hypothetical protein
MIVWWRFGKEHNEARSLCNNSSEVVAAHLDDKINHFRQIPEADWRWWQVDDHLLVERPRFNGRFFGPETRIYYLVDRGLTIIEDLYHPSLRDRWRWYIHIADLFYDTGRACWISKDMFCDVLIAHDARTHQLMDLDDLGQALEMELISPAETTAVLCRTQGLLSALVDGAFPLPEVHRAREACRALGW